MSLFGALSSGVSGLTAQSSAMGAISDNITNVSTVGYKNTQVDFSTLVTTQTSTTFYSAGGVQSRPRQDTGVQGLLAASTSQTDIAISGSGYFIVNESSKPTVNNEFLFTRAGSFFMDNEGYLRNTSGFYLQAWPVTADGTVTPNNEDLSIPNQNVISTDYLATVNLSRVGGTAAATTTIGIGANLPSNDTTGTTHKTDVQFFDTLGNANSMSAVYTKTARDNQWEVSVNPPPGASVLTLENSSGAAYKSVGQLEFTAKPNEGATVVIDGTTYEFSSDATIGTGNTRVTTTATSTAAQDVAALIAGVIATDSDFTSTNERIIVDPGNATNVLIQDDGTKAIAIDPTGLLTSSGKPASNQQAAFTVRQTTDGYRDYEQFKFAAVPSDGDTVTINGITYEFDASGNDDTQASTAATTTANVAATQVATLTDDNVASSASTHEQDLVTLSGVYTAGDTITVNLDSNGNDVYTVIANDLTVDGVGGGGTASAAQALANIATKVAAAINAGNGATSVGGTGVSTPTDDSVPSGISTAEVDLITLSGDYRVGDVINVTIDANTTDTYTVNSSDIGANQTATLSNVASGLAAVVSSGNGAGTISATAGASGAVITITADLVNNSFATATTVTKTDGATSSAGVITLTTGALNTDMTTVVSSTSSIVTAQVDTSTLSGIYEVGDIVTTNLGAGAVAYTVLAEDLTNDGSATGTPAGTAGTNTEVLTNIAAKVVIAMNADAGSAALATATSALGVVTFTAVTAGTGFTTTTSATNLSAGGVTAGNTAVVTNNDIATSVANLETAIEATDPEFAAGSTTVSIREDSNSGVVDTLQLGILSDAYTVTFNMATPADVPDHPDGTSPYTSGTAFTVDKSNAMIFKSDGSPSEINITEVEILDFENGAANMDDDPSNSDQITLDFGEIGGHNGMTQYGAEYIPGFITQDGSQFGTFAGVTIGTDGIVTALFDNGETRPVYQIPLATFTNVNSLGNRTGNVWNSSEASGDPTLRTADNGPAGQITQSSLEQSTVDIGTEFTKMIVVQRAFSAAAKIISTADEMLEELLRTKR